MSSIFCVNYIHMLIMHLFVVSCQQLIPTYPRCFTVPAKITNKMLLQMLEHNPADPAPPLR